LQNLWTSSTAKHVFVADTCRQSGPVSNCTVRAYGPFSNSGASLADRDAQRPSISNNGLHGPFIAFESAAAYSNPRANGKSQIYLVGDNSCGPGLPQFACSGPPRMVSVALDGSPGNGDSSNARITDDGQGVAFQSLATNFTNRAGGGANVFVTSTCPQLGDGGAAGDAGACLVTALGLVTAPPSCGHLNTTASQALLSRNGKVIVFSSDSTNLLPGTTTGGVFTGKAGP
jgi:hypothetical protein